jgi:quercetin dioxygenase-like cupin family protein
LTLLSSPLHMLRAWLFSISAVPLASAARAPHARRGAKGETVETLLATSETLLGQPLAYPRDGPAKVTADIITIAPGAKTGWHEHEVPLLAYVMQGELTVDYGPEGTHVYRNGDVIVEAIGTPHNGHNAGSRPVRLFAVFLGAEGVPDTVCLKGPQ